VPQRAAGDAAKNQTGRAVVAVAVVAVVRTPIDSIVPAQTSRPIAAVVAAVIARRIPGAGADVAVVAAIAPILTPVPPVFAAIASILAAIPAGLPDDPIPGLVPARPRAQAESPRKMSAATPRLPSSCGSLGPFPFRPHAGCRRTGQAMCLSRFPELHQFFADSHEESRKGLRLSVDRS
jgi:hypothetical protein